MALPGALYLLGRLAFLGPLPVVSPPLSLGPPLLASRIERVLHPVLAVLAPVPVSPVVAGLAPLVEPRPLVLLAQAVLLALTLALSVAFWPPLLASRVEWVLHPVLAVLGAPAVSVVVARFAPPVVLSLLAVLRSVPSFAAARSTLAHGCVSGGSTTVGGRRTFDRYTDRRRIVIPPLSRIGPLCV